MSEKFDLAQNVGLGKFVDIITNVSNGNFQTIVGESLNIKHVGTYTGGAADVLEGYSGGVIVSTTESITGLESGLLLSMYDATLLVDLMLMGDGEAKTELDGDTKDALQEIASQFFGALVVPVDTELSKKVSYRVNAVGKLQNTGSFQAESYVYSDFEGTLKGAPFKFRFFSDKAFAEELHMDAPTVVSTQDFFSNDFLADVGGESAGGGHGNHGVSLESFGGTNLDMLLDVEIPVSVRMGSAKLFLKDVLGLGPGNIVELEQNASDPIELMINGKLIALGEVVIVDGYFGFRIREIISKAERIKKLKD